MAQTIKDTSECQNKVDYALWHVNELKVPVFPLYGITTDGNCECGDPKCNSEGKHPNPKLAPKGHNDATTDLKKINEWWSKFPNSNIGVRTGDGLVVLDVDDRHDGHDSIYQLEKRYGPLPKTITVFTGSENSEHHYYISDSGIRSRNGFKSGLDVKADGGYVVGVGSKHKSGRYYRFDNERAPWKCTPSNLPNLIENELKKSKSKKTNNTNNEIQNIPEGGRNNYLTSYAGKLRHVGLQFKGILDALQNENMRVCDPVLEIEELESIARSVCNYEPGSSNWEKTVGFNEHKLPVFPLDTLPKFARELAKNVGEFTQTSVDLSAMMMLAVYSRPLLGNVYVEIEKNYVEEPALWVIVVLPSGDRKTPVFKILKRPLDQWQKNKVENWISEYEEISRERELQEFELKAISSKLKSGKYESEDEKKTFQESYERIQSEMRSLPTKPQLMFEDATTEEVVAILKRNGEASIMISDESGSFENMKGRYSNGIPNIDIYLKAYSGGSHNKSRSGSDTIDLENPNLSMFVTKQPTTLYALLKDTFLRKKGLFGRPFMIQPDSLVGFRQSRVNLIDESLLEDYCSRFMQLVEGVEGLDEKIVIKLSGEAKELRYELADAVELKLRKDGEFYDMQDWANKFCGNVIRISLVLHVIENVNNWQHKSISGEVFERATKIGWFAAEHARALLVESEANPDCLMAQRILSWIHEEQHYEFTKRDCHYRFKKSVSRVQELDGPLNVLEERCFIRVKSKNGRSVSFSVNPEVHND
jgi:hypothetical protein